MQVLLQIWIQVFVLHDLLVNVMNLYLADKIPADPHTSQWLKQTYSVITTSYLFTLRTLSQSNKQKRNRLPNIPVNKRLKVKVHGFI